MISDSDRPELRQLAEDIEKSQPEQVEERGIGESSSGTPTPNDPSE